jgi:hypothetical protein
MNASPEALMSYVSRVSLLVPFALSTLALAGCGGGPKDKLQGKWIGDRIENVAADQLVRATGWVKGTTLEFAGDKLTVTIPAEQARTGAYKVAKVEGQKISLDVTHPGQAVDDLTVSMTDEKTMRWDIGQGREIVLVRAVQ